MSRVHPAVGITAVLTLAFLYLPMLAVAVFSVNTTRYGLEWGGFSWKWYTGLFQNDQILEAARNTLVLAVVSTLIATMLTS